jgi:hypothetical protein
VEFGGWLYHEVVKAAPHRHLVFSVPKVLRQISPTYLNSNQEAASSSVSSSQSVTCALKQFGQLKLAKNFSL